ncbi:MAG: hypothetical protein JNG90_02855 [Planctomycetaceae bacterium]|nr:hypothetical protein [Planctomycetaceae bacterium]
MNYFAHGHRFLDDPYFVAGTALPDWLNIAARRVRVRSKHALPFTGDEDPRVAALARGIVQHHRDDAWFHETPAFVALSWELTVLLRDGLPPDEGFRPSFLGHILVELLLDWELIADEPARLERYYDALAELDPEVVQAGVNRMSPRPIERLAELIPLFTRERFLFDYGRDDRLWFRLNQVLRRVSLAPLPAEFCDLLPEARRRVAAARAGLLAPPAAHPAANHEDTHLPNGGRAR